MGYTFVVLATTTGSRLYPLCQAPTNTESDDDDESTSSSIDLADVPHSPTLSPIRSPSHPPSPPKLNIPSDLTLPPTQANPPPFLPPRPSPASASRPSVLPKFLLPLGGVTILSRLLSSLLNGSVPAETIIVATTDGLHGAVAAEVAKFEEDKDMDMDMDKNKDKNKEAEDKKEIRSSKDLEAGGAPRPISVVAIPSNNLSGSAAVVSYLSTLGHRTDNPTIPPEDNVIVLPSDLVLGGAGILKLLAESHEASLGGVAVAANGSSGNNVVRGITLLLSDVGEEELVDEKNTTLLVASVKEKFRKGLKREAEDIEVTGLVRGGGSSSSGCDGGLNATVVLKQNVADLEASAEEEGVGETAKLLVSKTMLKWGTSNSHKNHRFVLTTDMSDLHVYVLSPWVVRMCRERKLQSLQHDVVPMLVRRQENGCVEDCFGDSLLTQEKEEDEDLACSAENIGEDEAEGGEDGNGNGNDLNIRLGKRRSISVSSKNSKSSTKMEIDANNPTSNSDDNNIDSMDDHSTDDGENSSDPDDGNLNFRLPSENINDNKTLNTILDAGFVVNALILPRGRRLAMRSSTIQNYMFACKEIVSQAITSPKLVNDAENENGNMWEEAFKRGGTNGGEGKLPGKVYGKDSTLVLEGAEMGPFAKKNTIKNSTIGRGVKILGKVKINNCVLLDGCVIGEGVLLQNTVVGVGAVLEEKVTLDDCQVGAGVIVAAKTKIKGESLCE